MASSVYVNIMSECIPRCTISSRRNVSWMSKEIMLAIRKRNRTFKKVKHSMNAADFQKYKSLRNPVVKLLCEAKQCYYLCLNRPGSKLLWKTLCHLHKPPSNLIPTLNSGNGSSAFSDHEKALLLNNQFSWNFNYSVPHLSPANAFIFTCLTEDVPDDSLYVNENQVIPM